MSEKKFLIVVDMQKDFIDGSLGTREAQDIVAESVRCIRERVQAGYTVIATLDTHEEDYLDTPEGRKLPVRHCIRGTEGWQLHPEIREALGDGILVEKPTFGSVRLPGIIAESLGAEETPAIEILGLCTDICVISNALLLKANFPNAPIAVHVHCCAGVTPEKHRAALDVLQSCQIDLV